MGGGPAQKDQPDRFFGGCPAFCESEAAPRGGGSGSGGGTCCERFACCCCAGGCFCCCFGSCWCCCFWGCCCVALCGCCCGGSFVGGGGGGGRGSMGAFGRSFGAARRARQGGTQSVLSAAAFSGGCGGLQQWHRTKERELRQILGHRSPSCIENARTEPRKGPEKTTEQINCVFDTRLKGSGSVSSPLSTRQG